MRPWLACGVLLASCGSTITGSAGDASVDASANVDAPSGPCTWRAGAVTDLAMPGPNASCTLADMDPTGGGAWVLRACEFDVGAPLARAVVIDRVDANGGVAAPVRVSSGSTMSGGLSLAIDDALDRRAVLLPDDPSMGAQIVRVDRSGAPIGMSVIGQPPMSFSLGGYRDLMVNRAGYTAAAEQIRALWGASLLQADAMGSTVSQRDLGLPEIPTVRFERIGLPDRGFVIAWTGPMADATLRLRRYDEDGAPATRDAHTLDEHAATAPRVAVVPSGDGLMAVWETVADTFPVVRAMATRRLGADGTAAGEAALLTTAGFYGGGLHATTASGDVLVTAVTGSGVLRVVVLALDANGEARGEPIAVSMVSPSTPERTNTRIVATRTGALVAFQRDARTVSIAPITCERR